MAPRFDLNTFRLIGDRFDTLVKAKPKRLPRHSLGEPFLKGPIPWKWLAAAGKLSGKALHLGLCLWREAGCAKSRTIRFCVQKSNVLGVSLRSARRGMRALQRAGLISVDQKPGRCLQVTINDHKS